MAVKPAGGEEPRAAVIASDKVTTVSSFPYAHYRPGQKEAIDAARDAFAAGSRFVVIEAPTGSGKSGIAVTMAREADSAYIVTAQKLLQDQYVRDFPELALMKGRANYPCLIAPTHAAAAPCLAGLLPECRLPLLHCQRRGDRRSGYDDELRLLPG